jgi:hypothetical protein
MSQEKLLEFASAKQIDDLVEELQQRGIIFCTKCNGMSSILFAHERFCEFVLGAAQIPSEID